MTRGRGGKRGGGGGRYKSGFQGGFDSNDQYGSGGNAGWETGYANNGGYQTESNGNDYYSPYGGYGQGGFQLDNYSQDWYANDSYGNDYNHNGGYGGSYGQPSFRRDRRGYGRGGGSNQRGSPRGPKHTVPFKHNKANVKNAQANQQGKKNQQGGQVLQQTNGGKSKKNKKYHHSHKREAMYREKMSLKRKYTSVKQNKNLNAEEQIVLTYLKQVCHDLCEEKKKVIHFVLFSKVLSGHRNALKLFTYEARQLLEEKYGSDVEKKEELAAILEKTKQNTIKGFKSVFHKTMVESANIDGMEALLDTYIAKLTGETFTDDDIPVPEDYLVFQDQVNRPEEQMISEFKYRFVYNAFECFFFKPHEPKLPTKDPQKRLRFYLDNPIIPFMIVESVRVKGLLKSVPSPIDKYIFLVKDIFCKKTKAYMTDALAYLEKNGVTPISSPIANYISGADISTDVVRDFADCILLFDRFLTYIKFRITNYTPQILLSTETKEKIFNELVESIYRDVLKILVNKETLATQVYEEMESDPAPIKEEDDGAQDTAAENESVKMETN